MRTLRADTLAMAARSVQDPRQLIKASVRAAYGIRGLANHSLRNNQAAIANFTKVIKRQPKNTAAYFNRGLTKNIMNDQ